MFLAGAGVSTPAGVGLVWMGVLVGNGAEVGMGLRSSVGRDIGVGETILPVIGSISVAFSIDGSCQTEMTKSVTQQTATNKTASAERITCFLRNGG